MAMEASSIASQSRSIDAALKRCLHEIASARIEKAVCDGMTSTGLSFRVGFFYVAYNALFNDLVAHTIKVLDTNPNSATFWMILERHRPVVETQLRARDSSVDEFRVFWQRLRNVRNKTHFHIDRKAVLNPAALWRTAGIKWGELGDILDHLWAALQSCHVERYGRPFDVHEYSAGDVPQIVDMAYSAGLVPARPRPRRG